MRPTIPSQLLLSLSTTFTPIIPPTNAAQTPLKDPTTPLPRPLHDFLLTFHRNISRIESTTGNEAPLSDFLRDFLPTLNLSTHQQCLPSPSSTNKKPNSNPKPRCNIYAHHPSNPNPPILLSTHIDTVPPYIPYTANHTSSSPSSQLNLHGRGTVDAKAPLAAQLTSFLHLTSPANPSPIDPRALGLLLVVGEETSGDGMRLANALALSPRAVIFGEPTSGRLAAGHKGLALLRVAARGRAAHSGYPWMGVSATALLVRALGAVEDLGVEGRGRGLPWSDKYGNSTVNIGRVAGGVAGNVIPEEAHADLAVRIARGQPGEVRDVIAAAVRGATDGMVREKGGSAGVEMLANGYAPVDLDTDVDVGLEEVTVNFGTDVPNWRGEGRRYLFGPGEVLVAHSAGEGLTEGELLGGVQGYERLIRGVLRNIEEGEAAS